MVKPLFSICVITRNEEKTLPRLLDSLKEFREMGGEVVIMDTGSSDNTFEIAKHYGAKVHYSGNFLKNIKSVKEINRRFVVDKEIDVVKDGDCYFDFSEARNHCASLASNDVIFWYDADEVNMKMDIEKINGYILEGYNQFEYNFVFSFDKFGNEAIKFHQCKAYDKHVMRWTGIVHEIVSLHSGETSKVKFLTEDEYKLGHHQNIETGRHNYLKGLAVDCFNNPNNDRHSHYLARELMYNYRPKSAIKEFKRHIAMNKWAQEKAQSAIYIGDCYGMIGEPEKQVEWYNKGFYFDSSRREALIKLAYFYSHNKNHQSAICYAKAALEIPYNGFYGNNMAHYREAPHEILYHSYGWLGNIEKAKEHFIIAERFNPDNPMYEAERKYYFGELPGLSFIIPQLGREEGLNRCVESIKNLNYPQDKIEIIIDDSEDSVPVKVKRMVEKCKYNHIVFGANDVEFTKDSLKKALNHDKGLIAFNTGELYGEDKGNICEHFIIKKDLINRIGGEIFDTRFNHVGVDTLLWHKASKLGEAYRCEDAIVHHYHFSKGYEFDEVYRKGWSKVNEDREALNKELSTI